MKFTASQIEKLRNGLEDYRVLKAANGYLLPWKTVLDDLLMSPATVNKYRADGRTSDFKEEALRRFALGQSTLALDKLEDVRHFLLVKRILVPEEIADNEAEAKEALAVHAYLANVTENGALYLAGILPRYRTALERLDRHEVVELRVVGKLLPTLLAVEEHSHVMRAARSKDSHEKRDRQRIGASVRTGFAFVSSEHPVFHAFVRGRSRDDLIHYVQVGPMQSPARQTPILLVRSGSRSILRAGNSAIDKMLNACNILRFSSVEEVNEDATRQDASGKRHEEARPQGEQ